VGQDGDKSTRKVVVTTSADDQQLPKSVTDAMLPGEQPREDTRSQLISDRGPNPDYDPNGPKDPKTNPKTTTDHFIVDPETGDYDPYTKAKNGDPVEGTKHHAEQRMENSAADNGEKVLAQQPTKPCCPGCKQALGSDNLSKIPNP
jgi:hypothetical protein